MRLHRASAVHGAGDDRARLARELDAVAGDDASDDAAAGRRLVADDGAVAVSEVGRERAVRGARDGVLVDADGRAEEAAREVGLSYSRKHLSMRERTP